MSKIRNKLINHKRAEDAEVRSTGLSDNKESVCESAPNSEEDNPSFEVLQIKRRTKGVKYLVQIGENISWATTEDLIEDHAVDLVRFYENKLLVGSSRDNENSGDLNKKYLYVKY